MVGDFGPLFLSNPPDSQKAVTPLCTRGARVKGQSDPRTKPPFEEGRWLSKKRSRRDWKAIPQSTLRVASSLYTREPKGKGKG